MIKLIASDLDGTLLQKGAQTVSRQAIELIEKLLDNGIHFTAASGRQYNNLRRLFAPFADRISYIAENGSLCIHNGQMLSRSSIDHDLSIRAATVLYQEWKLSILILPIPDSYIIFWMR